MNLSELSGLATAGHIRLLEVVSLEGGFYVIQVHTGDTIKVLHDEHGGVLRLLSITHVREYLHDLAPVPCELVQHSIHDEMCGSRSGAIEPLRVPLSLVQQW